MTAAYGAIYSAHLLVTLVEVSLWFPDQVKQNVM